jgi:hypothetical protein
MSFLSCIAEERQLKPPILIIEAPSIRLARRPQPPPIVSFQPRLRANGTIEEIGRDSPFSSMAGGARPAFKAVRPCMCTPASHTVD